MNALKRFVLKSVLPLGRNLIDQINFQRKKSRATPVLVYQMGKVGSTSIYQSLLKQYPGAVLHTHRFLQKHKRPQIRSLYRWAVVEKRPLKVISLTRDPISRNVSAFFENFERDIGIPFAESNFSIEELKTLFLSKDNHELPLKWFDNNILKNFDIDVFAEPFPEGGVSTYSHKNVELLIIHLEISDDEKINAIKSFLSMDHFEINNMNVGSNKDYSSSYRMFKEKVKLPATYIDEMCESKYFNHFYSKEEIDLVRNKWSERVSR